jgi:hypothetical protein
LRTPRPSFGREAKQSCRAACALRRCDALVELNCDALPLDKLEEPVAVVAHFAGCFGWFGKVSAFGLPHILSRDWRPRFYPLDQLVQAATQYEQLQQLPDSSTVIGQRVIDYANQHPNDPKVPEALALTVRATRYACQNWRSVTPVLKLNTHP